SPRPAGRGANALGGRGRCGLNPDPPVSFAADRSRAAGRWRCEVRARGRGLDAVRGARPVRCLSGGGGVVVAVSPRAGVSVGVLGVLVGKRRGGGRCTATNRPW